MSTTTDKGVVLICDDDADARAIIAQSLSPLGYEIRHAVDGESACTSCEQSWPDVIVMDIRMPRMSGLEFVEWLRSQKIDRYIPVLLLSAVVELDSIVDGLNRGADDYLTKPYRYRELQARVKALFRIKDLTENLAARNRELQQTQAALVEKERELVAAQLAGAAAHNLGQPISAILLNINLLQREVGSNESVRLQAIQQECAKVQEMLEKLKSIDPKVTTSYLPGVSLLEMK